MTVCSESCECRRPVTCGDRWDFRKEVDKMKDRTKQITPQINNIADATGIKDLLFDQYKELLNSVPSNPSVLSRIKRKITES